MWLGGKRERWRARDGCGGNRYYVAPAVVPILPIEVVEWAPEREGDLLVSWPQVV